MKTLRTCARAGLLALAVLVLGPGILNSPASAHRATASTPVTVNVEFADNACVGTEYVEPSMDAPQVPGTSQEITGSVAPGKTVQVTYTALEGFVIEGQSSFAHTFPAEPASVTDCEKGEQPEPPVRARSATRTDCGGVDSREWETVTAYVWDGSAWVLGEPEVRENTGWLFVRNLTPAEKRQLGCLDAQGQQGNGEQGAPQTQWTVPTAVDSGLSDAAAAPSGPRWLVPLLGGVIMLGLAAFSRLKALGERPAGPRR